MKLYINKYIIILILLSLFLLSGCTNKWEIQKEIAESNNQTQLLMETNRNATAITIAQMQNQTTLQVSELENKTAQLKNEQDYNINLRYVSLYTDMFSSGQKTLIFLAILFAITAIVIKFSKN